MTFLMETICKFLEEVNVPRFSMFFDGGGHGPWDK